MDDDLQQQAQGIHQDMAFPALDLLVAVKTTLAPNLGGFGRLTVDHSTMRLGRSSPR